jgi:hypothetical protein
MNYALLADLVLMLHLGVVVFVVLGLPAILIGNGRGWGWVNRLGWRTLHLCAIGVVALQAWLGRYCPLTYLEIWLRQQAGQTIYQTSFVQHWVEWLIYYQAPLWVFALLYTAYGLLVAWAWWRYPPRRRRATR